MRQAVLVNGCSDINAIKPKSAFALFYVYLESVASNEVNMMYVFCGWVMFLPTSNSFLGVLYYIFMDLNT
jgi:TRAP-type mannitol/chloroaromatic compound transport system permease large subunit